VTLEDLRAEYHDRTIGERILSRVRSLVDQQLRHRDPMIYARGARHYRDGLEDVLHDFVIDVLLKGQLAYIFDTAHSLNEFDRLTNFQLRRYMAHTRQRTIVDNLIDRSIAVMEADDLIISTGSGGGRTFALSGLAPLQATRDEEALRRAAAVAKEAVPRTFSNPDDRQPKVYSDASLRTLLRLFLGEARSSVGRADLQALFEILLTPWLATVLGLDEAESPRLGDLEPDERVAVEETAVRIVERWDNETAIVFRYKLSNTADAQLAGRLGVSRPTAANKKKELFEQLQADLVDLNPTLRVAVLQRLAAMTDWRTL
jgi:hypothetical protein